MAISEIEKLERRYAENPQGLTFAPLAEVHRKNGDVAKALELLGPGLTIHPDYIPASIVLGRCHFDLGDMQAAEKAFTHVLGLDGENVIALKALADITERLLRLDESERWLHTLLSIDRSNDDARDQLERVKASRRQAEMASSASPGAVAEVESIIPATAEPVPEKVETDSFEADLTPSILPPPPPLPDLPQEPVMGWVSESGSPSSEEAMPLAFEDLRPEPDSIEPVEPLSGIVGMTDMGDVSHVEPLSGPITGGFHVELSEEIVLESSGATEFQMPNASEELFGSAFAPPPPPPPVFSEPEPTPPEMEPEPGAIPEPEFQPVSEVSEPEPVAQHAEPEPIAEHVELDHAEPEPVREPEVVPAYIPEAEPVFAATHEPVVAATHEPDPMMTESMAELLVSQGHRDEALRVYRELDDRLGGDARIREKIVELEQPRPAPPPKRQFAATATGGRSAGDFFRSILSSHPPHGAPVAARAETPRAGTTPEAGGAPTRPAHDTLSLSSVFGEESTPSRPAVPTSGQGAGQAGVSYDDFFNPQPSGGATRSPRSSDPKSDDLDQFHTWLQNLKR